MSFVLLVMGGAAAQQGWLIRTSGDGTLVQKAKDSHPKIAGAMALFFAIGAFGGMGSMLTQQQSLLSRCADSNLTPGRTDHETWAYKYLEWDEAARACHNAPVWHESMHCCK